MKQLPQNYDTKETETRWQHAWEEQGVYRWDETQPRENTYVIDTPPPTVSGLLHMGHIFSYTQADFIARYQRMKGKTVFYPMGFDDNGLPTERLVEKVKKIRATDMSREDFIKTCQEVVVEAEEEFRKLFKSVALSVDWSQEYQTISEHSRRVSQLSFLDLHAKGAAYRKLQPMLWDPVDQTAIAQAEVEDKELDSSFNDIVFGIEGSSETITIGTTRPELIPACVAIFYHPEDARYKRLAGKQAVTPLFGVKVPILTDDSVEMDKGTGIMMCCTFGDEKDIDKWRKHNLPMRVVLNKYGKMDFAIYPEDDETIAEDKEDKAIIFRTSRDFNDHRSALNQYNCINIDIAIEKLALLKGLKVSNKDPKSPGAREKILDMLREAGLLKESKPIRHAVKCAERSGAPLEILPTPQWFVKVLEKKEALKAKSAACTWYPEFMKIRMDQWIDGLNWDWCISRQRYFGVPFPVWYSKRAGEEGKILVAEADQLPVNPLVDVPKGYTREEVTPDMDVMDTWATSSVSPQISSHWQVNDTRHAQLFPADLRPQAHEIIRTWAFYTLVKAHYHADSVPWHNLMISGWCLAADKTKMSKSKGNVVTPVELIRDKGADAVRYWASTSRLGMDTAFSEDALKIGKKLVTKLWNAAKFCAGHLENHHAVTTNAAEDGFITEQLDKWILTRLRRATLKATQEFERYEYCAAREAIEDFFWNDLCDNYLELVKARAYGESSHLTSPPQRGEEGGGQHSALHTLTHCLEGTLRLFAPFVPHVTEELYSHIFAEKYEKTGSIHSRGSWPEAEDYPQDEAAEKAGIACVSILNAIRKLKSERNVSIKYPLNAVYICPMQGGTSLSQEALKPVFADLQNAANAAAILWQAALASGAQPTEDGLYAVSADFAEKAEAAAS